MNMPGIQLAALSVDEVAAATLSTLVGLVNEPNMPSGGALTAVSYTHLTLPTICSV